MWVLHLPICHLDWFIVTSLVYLILVSWGIQSTTNLVVGTIEMHCLTVMEAGSLKLRCQQGLFLLRSAKEDLFQVSLLAFGCSSGTLWLAAASLDHLTFTWHCPVSLHFVFLLHVCFCIQICSFYVDTSHTGSGPILLTHFKLFISTEVPYPNKVIF